MKITFPFFQYEAPVKYEMGGYGGYGSGSSAGNTGGAVQQSQGANAYDASRIILIKNVSSHQLYSHWIM